MVEANVWQTMLPDFVLASITFGAMSRPPGRTDDKRTLGLPTGDRRVALERTCAIVAAKRFQCARAAVAQRAIHQVAYPGNLLRCRLLFCGATRPTDDNGTDWPSPRWGAGACWDGPRNSDSELS
jgi:hypothetical protein